MYTPPGAADAIVVAQSRRHGAAVRVQWLTLTPARLCAVGTLAHSDNSMKGLAKELGMLELCQQAGGGSTDRVREAAAEVQAVLGK
jgi:hypothetical protein